MGRQQQEPIAYFDMNARRGLPPERVHALLHEVERRLGQSRCGKIEFIEPCGHGSYLIMFYIREAADLFERLYRQASGVPLRRSRTIPDRYRVVGIEASLTAILVVESGEVMRRRAARWN